MKWYLSTQPCSSYGLKPYNPQGSSEQDKERTSVSVLNLGKKSQIFHSDTGHPPKFSTTQLHQPETDHQHGLFRAFFPPHILLLIHDSKEGSNSFIDHSFSTDMNLFSPVFPQSHTPPPGPRHSLPLPLTPPALLPWGRSYHAGSFLRSPFPPVCTHSRGRSFTPHFAPHSFQGLLGPAANHSLALSGQPPPACAGTHPPSCQH